jgi:hypothetical protein
MDYYKIYKEGFELVNLYESLEAAQAVADSLPNQPYQVEFYAPYTPMTIQERLNLDMSFGQELVYVFVEDNRIMDITSAQSEAVLQKFRDILAFAQTGAITSIDTYLPAIPVDEVFTQERKDKYIQMITDYLAQFN